MSALLYAIQILSSLPPLIKAGIDVVDMIEKANDAIADMKETGRDPTDAEWDALNEMIMKLHAARPDVSGEPDS